MWDNRKTEKKAAVGVSDSEKIKQTADKVESNHAAILEVKDLGVFYGAIHALKEISFHVNAGEIVTLIGANGAGKTTTLQSISGLLPVKQGKVTFEGREITGQPAHKIIAYGLAQSPEGRRIFTRMTVEENLEMGAYLQKEDAINQETFEEVYDLFPRLKERRTQIAGTLSGGEQQMLAIGRALMSHPKLLMLDEPSLGLAPLMVDQIFSIIRKLHELGTTILLVEQNARAALKVADRCYVMETGRIVMEGSGAELLDSPEIKKAYLGG